MSSSLHFGGIKMCHDSVNSNHCIQCDRWFPFKLFRTQHYDRRYEIHLCSLVCSMDWFARPHQSESAPCPVTNLSLLSAVFL